MTKKIIKTGATLTILRPNEMSLRGRKNVAKWLTRQAKIFIQDGDKYVGKFRTRYE